MGQLVLATTDLVHLSRRSLKSTLKRFSEVRNVHLSRHFQPAAGAEKFEVFWYFRSWVELITYEDFAPKVVLIIMIFFLFIRQMTFGILKP